MEEEKREGEKERERENLAGAGTASFHFPFQFSKHRWSPTSPVPGGRGIQRDARARAKEGERELLDINFVQRNKTKRKKLNIFHPERKGETKMKPKEREKLHSRSLSRVLLHTGGEIKETNETTKKRDTEKKAEKVEREGGGQSVLLPPPQKKTISLLLSLCLPILIPSLSLYFSFFFGRSWLV